MNAFTTLRRFTLALTLGAAVTLPAMAQEATPDAAAPQSLLTRTQAVAELAAAQANGGMQVFSAGYTEPVQVGQSREAVRLATLLALSSGEVAAINHAAPDVLALGQIKRDRSFIRIAAR